MCFFFIVWRQTKWSMPFHQVIFFGFFSHLKLFVKFLMKLASCDAHIQIFKWKRNQHNYFWTIYCDWKKNMLISSQSFPSFQQLQTVSNLINYLIGSNWCAILLISGSNYLPIKRLSLVLFESRFECWERESSVLEFGYF